MANTPVDPSAATPGTQLLIRDGSTTLLAVDLMTPYRSGWKRNYGLAQAYGSGEAVRTGDGRLILEERQVVVILLEDSAGELAELILELDEALQDCDNLSYGDIMLEVVGSPGIVSVQYIGDSSAQVTITYLPRYGLSVMSSETVMGPT